jgi:hypothetical protein
LKLLPFEADVAEGFSTSRAKMNPNMAIDRRCLGERLLFWACIASYCRGLPPTLAAELLSSVLGWLQEASSRRWCISKRCRQGVR